MATTAEILNRILNQVTEYIAVKLAANSGVDIGDVDVLTINSVAPLFDGATNTLVTTGFVHHKIHDSDHYFMEGYTTLDNTDVLQVALVTPDTTKWLHLTWQISSNGILTTEFYEDAEGVSGGSAVTPLNNNRNSSNASGATITSGVSVTGSGTLISRSKWGGTGFKSFTGGASTREDEMILKQNTTYMRKFISGSDANIVGFKAMWYENTSL